MRAAPCPQAGGRAQRALDLSARPTCHAPARPAGWDGGMVLVSHDFRLISQVAKEIWLVEGGAVKRWDSDIVAYKDHLRKSHAALSKRQDLAN